MTREEAEEQILVQHSPRVGIDIPTCGECGGCGLGYASVEHHHACTVAAAIPDALRLSSALWRQCGYEPRTSADRIARNRRKAQRRKRAGGAR